MRLAATGATIGVLISLYLAKVILPDGALLDWDSEYR